MDPLILLAQMAVYLLMAGTVVSAIAVVTCSNLFHSALALVGTLLGVAGIYLAIRADFLAVVQILLYVGAVMTLVIFAIMLTQNLGGKSIRQDNRLAAPALLNSTLLFFILSLGLTKFSWNIGTANAQARLSAGDLGRALMGTYVFPFEVISVILIAALLGALMIAKRDKHP